MGRQLPAPRDPGGRPLSGVERVWLTGARLLPPFAFQWVLEGEGTLDVERVRESLQSVAEALPAVRGRRRGWLRGTRWTWTGPVPAVRTVHGLTEVVEDPVQAVEVVLLPPDRMALRVEHALMDGRGSLVVLQALFAALRGEEILSEEPVEDLALVAPLGVEAEVPPPRDALPAVPLVGGQGRRWVRRRVEGRPSQVVARACLALARHARELAGEEGPVRIDLPVDLRRHRPGLRCTANLTGFARLELLPGQEPAALRRELDTALAEHGGARVIPTADRLRGVPLWLMAMVGRAEARKGLRTGRYSSSATVSSLGRVDLGALSCPGWQTRRAFVIPPANPDLPLLLTLTGDARGIELCGTSPGAADPTPAVEAVAEALRG